MKVTDQQLDVGTHVYASLGYMTVKAGQVNGMRTEIKGNERPSLEYWVLWFGAGDRKDQAEWIESRHVHLSPNAAFDKPDAV